MRNHEGVITTLNAVQQEIITDFFQNCSDFNNVDVGIQIQGNITLILYVQDELALQWYIYILSVIRCIVQIMLNYSFPVFFAFFLNNLGKF